MGQGFFDLSTSKDMYEKACREYAKLKADLNSDNFFNFFVTAYHVNDYLREEKDPRHKAYKDNPHFAVCQAICNTAKHYRIDITRRANSHLKEIPEAVKYSGAFGGAPLGSMVLSGGDQYVIYFEKGCYDLEDVAYRVISELRQIFE